MKSRSIPVLHLHGGPYERGKQHGVALSLLIHASLSALKSSIKEVQWLHAKRLAAISWQELTSRAARIALEIEGIADGCGLPPLHIYLLSGFEFFDGAIGHGCTTAAYSTGHGAFVAQNWDAPPGMESNLVLLKHDEDNEGSFMVTSPGTLGWVGMNIAGLALVTNDLMLDVATQGLPSLVARRLLLQERNVAGALAKLSQLSHRSGRCYLFADAAGQVGGVEISPSIGAVALTSNELVHTNHPVMPPIAIMENTEAVAKVYPSSRERLRVAKRHSIRNVDDVRRLLSDTTGTPDSICKSASQREATQTAFSVIFECKDRRLSICLGRPDRGQFEQFDLRHVAAV